MQVYSHVVLGICSEKYPSMHYSVFSTQHIALCSQHSALTIRCTLFGIHIRLDIANFGTAPVGLFTCQLGLPVQDMDGEGESGGECYDCLVYR